MEPIDVNLITEQYLGRIYRAALVLTGNPWDADDLTQETFLVCARRYDQFEGRSSIYTWLYGILLNLERRHRRDCGTRQRKLAVFADDASSHDRSVPPAEAAVEVAEWKAGLWSHVATLPDGQRQVLVLRFSEGLRYEEIAAALECPLGTVKSRIYHGLLALRRRLEELGADVHELPDHPDEDLKNHAI